MHANAMAARPGIIYFSGVTIWAIEQIRKLRKSGVWTMFTVDAGPHVVALTEPDNLKTVVERLSGHPEVVRIIESSIGGPAQLLEAMPEAPA